MSKSSNRTKATKVCAVNTCQYSKGTRENVKMFRIPQDDETFNLWNRALQIGEGGENGEHKPIKGMICIQHFHQNDIMAGNRLRKNAIPIIERLETPETPETPDEPNVIVTHEILDGFDTHGHPDDPPDLSNLSDCGKCNILQTELNSIKEDFFEMKRQYETKINKMEVELCNATAKLSQIRIESRNLNKRLEYAKSTKENLKKTLQDLSKQNLLSKEVVDFVEVRMTFCYYACFNFSYSSYIRVQNIVCPL